MQAIKKSSMAPWMVLFYLGSFGFFNTACNNNPAVNSKDSVAVKKDSAAAPDTAIPVAVIPAAQDSTKQYVYLTFDDGPQPPGTSHCFNVCKELNAKASFFMVGVHANDAYRRKEVDSIRNAYPLFLLCNHSSTHAFGDKYKYFYNHPQLALEDIFKAQQTLNVPLKIMRLPGNNAWVRQDDMRSSKQTKAVCQLLDSAGYNVIGWDVEWSFKRDGSSRPVENVETMIKYVNNALNNRHCHVRNNVVILAHDRMFRRPDDADSLHKFIAGLEQNPNYVLQTIDKYPRLKTK